MTLQFETICLMPAGSYFYLLLFYYSSIKYIITIILYVLYKDYFCDIFCFLGKLHFSIIFRWISFFLYNLAHYGMYFDW